MIPWKTASDSQNSCVQVARGARCAGGDCLEAVRTTGDHGRVLVRDSKECPVHFRTVQLTPREWAELLRAVRIEAEHPAIKKVAGRVLLGWSGQPILEYTDKEWIAFAAGALKGVFEYESLHDVTGWVDSSPCTCDKLSGPAEASPGGGPAAGREGLDTGQTSSTRAEARHDHDPTSNPVSRVLPVVQAEKAATGAVVTSREAVPVAAHEPPAETTPGKRESPEGVLTAIGPEWRPDPATGAGGVADVSGYASASAPASAPVAAEPIPRMVPTTCGRCYPRARCVCRDYDSPAGRPVDASSGVKTSVVADQPGSFDDELDLLYSPAGRLDEDPAPPLGPSLATAPAAGQPGSGSSNTAVTEERPVTDDRSQAGTGALPPALVPVAEPRPNINFALLTDLRGKPHPLLHIGDFDPGLPLGVGEVMQEARTAHHLLDMVGIPRGVGYAQDLDARTWLAVVKLQQLEEQLERIADWHSRIAAAGGTFDDYCNECREPWPCDTRRMATGSYVDEDSAWAKAVAPLVPTDGAS